MDGIVPYKQKRKEKGTLMTFPVTKKMKTPSHQSTYLHNPSRNPGPGRSLSSRLNQVPEGEDLKTLQKKLKKITDYLINPFICVTSNQSDVIRISDGSIRIIRDLLILNPDDPFFDRIG